MKNMKLIKATEAEIQQFIAQHTTWSVEEDKLHIALDKVRTSQLCAPAFITVFANSLRLVPVVIMSSTSRIR
jgi:hypothetical protein